MNWDDIKVFLALCRRGSARAAAQELGVSNSTVTRRLDELERHLQTHLFDRTPDGYRMTAASERLLPSAEHVEELLLSAERRITGGDQHLEGSIRLTMPDVPGMNFLMEGLAVFAQKYPGIELDLVPSHDELDLTRREADIAIRNIPAGTKPPDYLIGRYLGSVTASSYVHRDLLDPEKPEDVSRLTWIGKNPVGQREDWLNNTDFPTNPVRHSIVNYNLLADAVRNGMGMAFMPCFVAYDIPEIVRVPGANIVYYSDVWVLTHKDLRLTARLRVLRELIAEEFAKIAHKLDTR
ncbi:MAG: LysR family transcriptional regulator [Parahaliea sp.]